jgi:hypothetical protein
MADEDPLDPDYMERVIKEGGMMPLNGYVFDQGVTESTSTEIQAIVSAINRAGVELKEVVDAKGHPPEEHEALYRVTTGVSMGSIEAITNLIMHGSDPRAAVMGVLAGVGAMMFSAGRVYERELHNENRAPVATPSREMLVMDDEETSTARALFGQLSGEFSHEEEG